MNIPVQSRRLRDRSKARQYEGEENDGERLFLTAVEVGTQLGLGKSRVYELAAAGLLPAVRLGRRLLFPRRGLEELARAAIERAKAECFSTPPGADVAAAANHSTRTSSSTRPSRLDIGRQKAAQTRS